MNNSFFRLLFYIYNTNNDIFDKIRRLLNGLINFTLNWCVLSNYITGWMYSSVCKICFRCLDKGYMYTVTYDLRLFKALLRRFIHIAFQYWLSVVAYII